jgi:REP element-mobilizing transposase RayT
MVPHNRRRPRGADVTRKATTPLGDRLKLPRSKTPLRDLATYGHGRAVRHQNCDYAGDIDIHVTICADHGEPFGVGAVATMVCESVEVSCRMLGYRLYGYCLMPDHLHVLLSPGKSGHDLAKWLGLFKSYTTHRFMKMGQKPPLWKHSANDHVCREGETAETVLKYIAENPVRAQLADDWRNWRWTKVFIEI